MRRRKLKRLWKRLHALQRPTLSRDRLLLKLGAAKKDAGRIAWSLVKIAVPDSNDAFEQSGFDFKLNKDKLRTVQRREGRYLLRSNLADQDPAVLWKQYIVLTEVEQAFKNNLLRKLNPLTSRHTECPVCSEDLLILISLKSIAWLSPNARVAKVGLAPLPPLPSGAVLTFVVKFVFRSNKNTSINTFVSMAAGDWATNKIAGQTLKDYITFSSRYFC